MSSPGRNAPCPCGSGQKYKLCCLRRSAVAAEPLQLTNAPVSASGRRTFEEALRFHRLGLLNEADGACRAVLRQDPRHVGALRILANIAYGSGRRAEAADLLTRATRASPHDAGVHCELGLVQIGLKRPAEAIPMLRRALTIEPSLVAAHVNLGIALRELGRVDEAEAACRKALELDPRCSAALETLAELFKRRGRLQDARECLELALQLAPDSMAARVGLGDVLVDLGEFRAGVASYREALAASPNTSAIYVRLGIALQEMGDVAGSLETLRLAVASSPGSPEPHYHLARALLVLGQVPEAVDSVQEAIRLHADFSSAHALYSTALAVLGDLEGAITRLKMGLEVETTRSRCLAILGGHLLEIGHRDRALECFKQKLECEPDDATTRHYVMALSGLNPDHPSDQYVREVFDGCADSFDRSLVAQLGYSVPRELTNAIVTASTHSTPWDVLDLGCGTGLVGVELAAHVRSLVGVDLSEKMLELARERKVYTNLICADLMSALHRERPSCYDVVSAADVFIYVGKLDSVVPAVRRTLRANGLFAFSTEAAEDGPSVVNDSTSAGYQLATSGRYAHKAVYLQELALRNGFEIKLLRKTRLRLERRRPVIGWLTVWSAT